MIIPAAPFVTLPRPALIPNPGYNRRLDGRRRGGRILETGESNHD